MVLGMSVKTSHSYFTVIVSLYIFPWSIIAQRASVRSTNNIIIINKLNVWNLALFVCFCLDFVNTHKEYNVAARLWLHLHIVAYFYKKRQRG